MIAIVHSWDVGEKMFDSRFEFKMEEKSRDILRNKREEKKKEMKWKKSISSFFCPGWIKLHHLSCVCESLFVRVEIISSVPRFFQSLRSREFKHFFHSRVENEFAPKKSASFPVFSD